MKTLEQKFITALDVIGSLSKSKKEFNSLLKNIDADLIIDYYVSIYHNGDRFLLYPDKNERYLIQPKEKYCPLEDYSINLDKLIQKIPKIIGKNEKFQIKISDPSIWRREDKDMRLYVTLKKLLNKEILGAESLLFLPNKKRIYVNYFKSFLKAYLETEDNSKDNSNFPSSFIKILKEKSEDIEIEKSYLELEFSKPLKSLNNFIELVKKNAEILKADYIIKSLNITALIKDLEILQKPPYIELNYKGEIEFYYNNKEGEEELKIKAPKTKFSKIAEFFNE